MQFLVRDRHLFRRVNKNVLLQGVIDKTEDQIIILKQLQNENEHREREEIYRRCQRADCKFCVISKHKQLICESFMQYA